MHELAFGITSNNYVTGPAHPYDKSKIPGVLRVAPDRLWSSRQFPAGLGTDTGGRFGYRPRFAYRWF